VLSIHHYFSPPPHRLYADDVALLAEMLEVLILSLHVIKEESRPFDIEIKTKIQTTDNRGVHKVRHARRGRGYEKVWQFV